MSSESRMNWAAISVTFALIIQLAALVWGAATLSNGLASLQLTVAKLEVVGKTLSENLSDVTTRLRILEYRLEDTNKRLERGR